MIDNELFSIIMPAFNAEKTLKTSVDSVLSQTESRFRLYIVNDASTDNTKKIIDSISDVRVVKIDSATNLGVAGARNLALKVANGKYISFLDSDDIWSSEKLEEQLKKLEQGWDVV
ncbi:glycosyltransferase, partial [Citrobacter portucalensis]|uniref:glycosyltransferase family 2 protein n=1 Tax=Citrobacter portucalensis TaxID=1639133 RepID=UPI00226B4B2A